jgi:hypothetical protein
MYMALKVAMLHGGLAIAAGVKIKSVDLPLD